MKSYRYRVTLEEIAGAQGGPPSHGPLSFEAANHDDIFRIVEAVRNRGEFDGETAAAFAVGLKLFSEVMLQNRSNPLFAPLKEAFPAFMKELKKPREAPQAYSDKNDAS